jgi:hypothetical protein
MSGEQKRKNFPLTPTQNLKFGALFTALALGLAMAVSGGSMPF